MCADSTESDQIAWTDVHPLLHFKADWCGPRLDFGHDLSVVGLSEEAKREYGDVETSPFYSFGFVHGEAYSELDWVALMEMPDAIQHVSTDAVTIPSPGGGGYTCVIPDFERNVAGFAVTQFVRSLRLVKETPCTTPDRTRAQFTPDAAILSLSESGVDMSYSHHPQGPPCPPFEAGDLPLVTGMWDALYRLFNLHGLRRKVFSEVFFAELDAKATEIGRRFSRGIREKDDGGPGEGFIVGGSPAEQRLWALGLREVFLRVFEEVTSNETRLGRAVATFDEGRTLSSDLHAFLSMFLVLENLFNTEPGSTTHKIAVRATRILWDFVPNDYPDRKMPGELTSKRRLFRAVKDLYRDRSNVIHGSLPFSKISLESRSMIVYLTRRCLQTILLNKNLFELFSHRQTAGSEPHQLRDFFRGLELGEDK